MYIMYSLYVGTLSIILNPIKILCAWVSNAQSLPLDNFLSNIILNQHFSYFQVRLLWKQLHILIGYYPTQLGMWIFVFKPGILRIQNLQKKSKVMTWCKVIVTNRCSIILNLVNCSKMSPASCHLLHFLFPSHLWDGVLGNWKIIRFDLWRQHKSSPIQQDLSCLILSTICTKKVFTKTFFWKWDQKRFSCWRNRENTNYT